MLNYSQYTIKNKTAKSKLICKLKKAFPNNKFSVIYKRKENLKEMVAPSLYHK